MKDKEQYIKELEFELQKQYGKYYTNICVEYAKKLLENNLPVIFDFEHLSLLLGINKEKFLLNSFSFLHIHPIE